MAYGPTDGQPTPIQISRTTRNILLAAFFAVLALIVWAVPVVLVVSLGGFAIAMILSFPVHFLSRTLPRGLAILIAFLILLAVVLIAAFVFLPLILSQTGALVNALPGLIDNLERRLISILQWLHERDLLPGRPEDIAARLGGDIKASIRVVVEKILGNTLGLLFGTFSFALTLFAVVFVAASLLANVRNFKAAFLAVVPRSFHDDAHELWDNLAHALSRYLGGLALVLVIQGVISAIALALIGVPYPLALGAWVSISAIVPYLGAWIGAVPAVLVAFSISPTAVILTALAFLAIQQLEGNVLTPRIQGHTINVPSLIIFLTVIAAGALFGLTGVLFAVPALAVLRVLYDFFRVRLTVLPAG